MTRGLHLLRRLGQDCRGAALVELAIAVPLVLLFVFGILDFGRLYWIETTLQKAMHIAARTAALRSPVCAGVPTTVQEAPQAPGQSAPRFGTLCRAGGICADAGDQSCALSTDTATGREIWDRIEFLLPPGATPANVRVTYSFDDRLGFLGGPYTPVVTAEIVNLDFQFVLPLGALAALAANDPTLSAASFNRISLPSMSTSLPGEDLASGIAN